VWDATTGEPITPPLHHGSWLTHAAFSPDGRWVVTASDDNTARVWALDPERRPLRELHLLARLLSAQALYRKGGAVPVTAAEFRQSWRQLRRDYPHDPAGYALPQGIRHQGQRN